VSEVEPDRAGAGDAIRIPGAVVTRIHEPASTAELGQLVADASRGRRGLLVAGGRTRIRQANPARGIEQALSMRALAGVDVFEPEEGVVHARAGTPIREIHRMVRVEGWELPLDPPGATSTLGGTLAAAATGPREQAFGRVRDAVLGLELVGADGVASKCGGRVVKNVTGYDLAKLHCGARGSLAVITGAWLRLRPPPARRVVLAARVTPSPAVFEVCRSLTGLTNLRALVWEERRGASDAAEAEVVVELGGREAGLAHDRERIEHMLAVEPAADDRIDAIRDARADLASSPVALSARVLGTECHGFVRRLVDAGLSVSADPGIGRVRATGALERVEALLALCAAAREAGGFAMIETLPDAWREGVDVFGGEAEGAGLAASLKQRFDPHGILNPGRHVGGL
jgi:glycolate oxidase FAD binding subunit